MYNKYFFLSICIAFVACKTNTSKEGDAKEEVVENKVQLTQAQFNNAKIETAFLQEKKMATTLKLYGKIDVPPQNIVSVSAPLGGYLLFSKLLPGMHVSKGEVIATLEDQQFIQLQQDYLLAKTKLHFAELEYNRQKELNESQASSNKITQQALAEVNIQQITMNAIAEKLKLIGKNPSTISANNISKKTNIYSSINGYVSKVNVNIGKYITPADVMFELIDPSDIHLNMKVFEKDIAKLSIGQRVIAYSNSSPEKKYDCEIILISKDITADGTADVHCHFEGLHKSILPGMYMNADVSVAIQNEKVIPEACVVNFEGKNYVFVETEKYTYEMLEVNIRNIEKGFSAILNEKVLANKKIVQKGAYTLLMKLKNVED